MHIVLSKHFLINLIPSHGVNRLEMYISEIQEGEVDHKVQPEIVSETESIACVDGHNGLGRHSFEIKTPTISTYKAL